MSGKEKTTKINLEEGGNYVEGIAEDCARSDPDNYSDGDRRGEGRYGIKARRGKEVEGDEHRREHTRYEGLFPRQNTRGTAPVPEPDLDVRRYDCIYIQLHGTVRDAQRADAAACLDWFDENGANFLTAKNLGGRRREEAEVCFRSGKG